MQQSQSMTSREPREVSPCKYRVPRVSANFVHLDRKSCQIHQSDRNVGNMHLFPSVHHRGDDHISDSYWLLFKRMQSHRPLFFRPDGSQFTECYQQCTEVAMPGRTSHTYSNPNSTALFIPLVLTHLRESTKSWGLCTTRQPDIVLIWNCTNHNLIHRPHTGWSNET